MSKTKKFTHHSKNIDEVDLDRIITKIGEITKIITWLNALKDLDPTVNKGEINSVIKSLNTKKKQLISKRDKAIDTEIEEAEFVCKSWEY